MRQFLLPLLIILLVACSKENKNFNSRFTIINAVPDGNSFTLLVGDIVVDSGIQFGNPKFNLTAPAATTTVRWKHQGVPGFDSAIKTDVANNADFTLFFYDSLKYFKSYLIRDEWKQAASKTKGYIRFFQMVIGAGRLKLANDTNKVLVAETSFGAFSGKFIEIDSFITKLRLYNGTAILDSIASARVEPGKSYSIYAVGVLNQTDAKKPRLIIHEHQ
ncbi:MAG: hypothetical protein V4717_23910 [Bacteroidota bacterium]